MHKSTLKIFTIQPRTQAIVHFLSDGYWCSSPSLPGLLTVCSLDVVALSTGRFHLQQLHGAVQQAVNHLKTGTLVVEDGTETPAVPRPDIWWVG